MFNKGLTKHFNIAKAGLKKQRVAITAYLKNTPEMRKTMMQRERDMAFSDGQEMSEDELEYVVNRQMENNPYRVAMNESIVEALKAVHGDG